MGWQQADIKASYIKPKTVTQAQTIVNALAARAPTAPPVAPKPTPTPTNNTAALQAALAAVQYSAPISSGGGGVSAPAATPARTVASIPTTTAAAATPATTIKPYTPQAYSVNLPTIDWGFTPTTDQQTGWNTQATATAGQEIDPQLLAIKQALDSYMTQGQNTRNELNPRYTNQSLGIANIIQNSVKQDAINNAIRRGADTSGWLTSALMDAGKLETEQRSGIEANRNQDLSALAALEAQQTQAAGQQNIGLEKLRGQRITTALADLQNQAMAQDLTTKQNQWNSALGGEQLRASNYGANESNRLSTYQTQTGAAQSEYQRAMEAAIADAQNKLGYYNTDAQTAISEADRALQASIAENNQANTVWEQNYTTAQDAYNKQQAAAAAAQNNVRSGTGGNYTTVSLTAADLNKLFQ